ncbi:alpha/beta fold hydrolase [Nonomuraea antimicrobica]
MGWPAELVGTLVSSDRQVIRFDHRDTGRSDCVDFTAHPYALADLAGDALAVLDAYDVTRAHVAGASLGGAIAQWLAVHRPERVATLTVIMSGPWAPTPGPPGHARWRGGTPTLTTCPRPHPASSSTSRARPPHPGPPARRSSRRTWRPGGY